MTAGGTPPPDGGSGDGGGKPKPKARRSRKTPVAGSPEASGATPKPRRSRKTPVAGTPEASQPIPQERPSDPALASDGIPRERRSEPVIAPAAIPDPAAEPAAAAAPVEAAKAAVAAETADAAEAAKPVEDAEAAKATAIPGAPSQPTTAAVSGVVTETGTIKIGSPGPDRPPAEVDAPALEPTAAAAGTDAPARDDGVATAAAAAEAGIAAAPPIAGAPPTGAEPARTGAPPSAGTPTPEAAPAGVPESLTDSFKKSFLETGPVAAIEPGARPPTERELTDDELFAKARELAAAAGNPGPYEDAEGATLPVPEEFSIRPDAGQRALPDPAQAALEAARIAEQIVGDYESASGAAIVAAAAAGAAIEAARMRALAGEPNVFVTEIAAPGQPPAATDPVTTVRMQRERVLRALAVEVAANAAGIAPAEPAPAEPGGRAKRPTDPPKRAPSHPGRAEANEPVAVDEVAVDDGELDPVRIAAVAIQKLRARASTDFAGLRGHYHRHDIVVLVLAFLIIVIAGRAHRSMVTPPTVEFAERGLVFEHSQAWLAAEPLSAPAPRIARDPTGQPPRPATAYNVAFTSSIDPSVRLEVLIDKKPAWSNIVTGLELDRRTRWGELYTLDDSSIRSIEDQDWLRTEYRYAHATDKGDVPRVDRAVEYATIDREQIYVITLFGTPAQLERIESVVAPTLRVPTRSGLPLVPQTRSLGQRTYPNPVARAFDSTVMVVVADLVDGRLKARGGGSGVIVGADGSVLTNYHVIHDKDGRLHDVFVIGRFSTLDRAPQLQCAGRPNRSKLHRELDLALVKCDLDLDGRTWLPSSSGVWATLPEARTSEVRMGQRLWVLGYPDAGGGGLTLSQGEVEGWTGQDGTQGKDFIKTDASITHGNSGGPVVDDSGQLVGIASASRTKITASGDIIEMSQVGLVRPLSTASDLLAIAAAGWTPREGHTEVELQPSAVEAPSEGVRIGTRIRDAANQAPVRDALVMVLKPGVNAKSIDVNRLDDQVLSWGRSNSQGEVHLKQPVPVPGTYTVMVIAHGYEPLIGAGALTLDAKTPPNFDPWGEIKLLAR